jgi:5-methyltetrahydrofolate--homocysteine methyltransferase
MLKNNWDETTKKFDGWWNRQNRLRLIVADVSVKAPSYKDIEDFSDFRMNLEKHKVFFGPKSFHGEVFPDLAPYLGPGSLSTFIGSKPIYSENTIWFSETESTLEEIKERCEMLVSEADFSDSKDFAWYKWTIDSAKYYKSMSGNIFRPSMPDLQQNLDILSAVMGPERLLVELIDDPEGVMEVMDKLYMVWEKVFDEITDIIMDDSGYTAYTHYNLLGKGSTSVLQSDISCMLSEDMFRKFEMPYLKKQAERIDNVIYHLDGPGAVRHLDALLEIKNINAIQWVPGAGTPGNADESYFDMYDKIIKADKGLYVFLNPWEIKEFVNAFSNCRLLIRTRAENEEEQLRLVEEYS